MAAILKQNELTALDAHLRQALFDPGVPVVHAGARLCGNLDDLHSGIDLTRKRDGLADVEIEMRQQIGLVQQEKARCAEHVRILDRLILALGDRENGDLRFLAEIKTANRPPSRTLRLRLPKSLWSSRS